MLGLWPPREPRFLGGASTNPFGGLAMNRKYLVGVLLLGGLAGLAIGRRQEVAPTTGTSTPAILFGGCQTLTSSSEANYVAFGLGQIGYPNCEAGKPVTGIPMPSAGILQNLRVAGGQFAKSGAGGVVIIWVNQTSTTITCTVDESGTCSDTIHTVNVSAGDTVAATFTPGLDRSAGVSIALEKQ
jgi:hypothetical protein